MEIINHAMSAVPGNQQLGIYKNKRAVNNEIQKENSGRDYKPIEWNSVDIPGKPDIKEAASEMLIKQNTLGEFKDKNVIEEAIDPHLGPDIRFALKSKNLQFLKRILWGPLTVGEYREVKYRMVELEKQNMKNINMVKGQIIDTDS